MRRLAMLAICGLSMAAPAAAFEWLHCAWYKVKSDWKTANHWPDPYILPDRELVREPFYTQIEKGWRTENTLSNYHFDAEGKLTEAGQLKLQSILFNTPEQYRVIVVQNAPLDQTTAARLASVQENAQSILGPDEPLPQIAQTNRTPISSPADYLESIQRQFNATTPVPRLPVMNTGSIDDGTD
jgi:hypothetical protein